MPFIRSLLSNYYNWLIITILLLGKVMPSYSCYVEKKLIYVAIAALFGC